MSLYEDRKRELLTQFKSVYDYVIRDILTLLGYGEAPIKFKSSTGELYIKSKIEGKNPYFLLFRRREGQDDVDFFRCPIDNGKIEFDSEGIFKLHLCQNFEDITLTIRNIDVFQERQDLIDYSQRRKSSSAEIELSITDLEDPGRFVATARVCKNGRYDHENIYTGGKKTEKYNQSAITINKRTGLSIFISSSQDSQISRELKYNINEGATIVHREAGSEGMAPVILHRTGNSHFSHKIGSKETDGLLITPVEEGEIDFFESAMLSNLRVSTTIGIGIGKVDRATKGLNHILASLSPTYRYITAFAQGPQLPLSIARPNSRQKEIVAAIVDSAALFSCNTEKETAAKPETPRRDMQYQLRF